MQNATIAPRSNVTDTKLSEYFIIDLEANSETYDGFAAFDDLSADAAGAAGTEAILEDEICSGFIPIELGEITTEEPQEDASVIVVEVKKETNQVFGVEFADRPGGGVYVCGAIPGSPGATSSGLVIGFDVIEANFQSLDESSSMLDLGVILTNAENDVRNPRRCCSYCTGNCVLIRPQKGLVSLLHVSAKLCLAACAQACGPEHAPWREEPSVARRQCTSRRGGGPRPR